MKKKVLDLLYPLKASLYKKSNHYHDKETGLDSSKIADRNLAAGSAQSFATAAAEVDAVIDKIIKIDE